MTDYNLSRHGEAMLAGNIFFSFPSGIDRKRYVVNVKSFTLIQSSKKRSRITIFVYELGVMTIRIFCEVFLSRRQSAFDDKYNTLFLIACVVSSIVTMRHNCCIADFLQYIFDFLNRGIW